MLFYIFFLFLEYRFDRVGVHLVGSCLLEGRGKGARDEVMVVVVGVVKGTRRVCGRGVVM